MRRCSTCKVEQDEAEFGFKDKAKTRFQSICKSCARAASKRHYARNKAAVIANNVANSKARRDAFQEYKATLQCLICPENDPSCLDFHHKDPNEKDFQVSQIADVSKERFLAEIAKCAVLCANCHRKLHAGLFSLI